jgi:hypothetical protein
LSEALYDQRLTAEQLARLSKAEQRDVMERWFRERYESPDHRTPYDSEDGDYVWIWGGPYDAKVVLQEEFEGIVADAVIAELVDDLNGEAAEWAPVESEGDYDYDHDLLDIVTRNANALQTLRHALNTVKQLLDTTVGLPLAEALNRLLFANVITVMETYLADTFINRVLSDSGALRKFVESSPEFRKTTIPYSDVLSAAERVSQDVKRHLLDLVWHNLQKVQAMYRASLGVDFGAGLGEVARAIPKRHDIVHRNGKDKDGNSVSIAPEDVRSLIVAVERLAAEVERQLELQLPEPPF